MSEGVSRTTNAATDTHSRGEQGTLLMEISGASTVKVERSSVEALNSTCSVPLCWATFVVAQAATCERQHAALSIHGID